jgi:hypothetical protein
LKAHELNLDSIALTEFKNTMDREIGDVVRLMKEKGLSEGSVSAKIKITVMTGVDENGEFHNTAIFEPKVTSRIGSQFENKCGATGGRITITDDGSVILGQISMDEVMAEKEGA